GEVRLRMLRLLLDRQRTIVLVELDDAVALRIVNAVCEYGRAGVTAVRAAQRIGQAVAIEDVVAENQTARIAADKLGTDEERLRQAARVGLLGVREADPPLRTVAEEVAER